MDEFYKRLYSLCMVLSIVGISSMLLYSSLYKKSSDFYRTEIRKGEEVLGESVVSNKNSEFSLSVQGSSETPTSTYSDKITLYGKKPQDTYILVMRDNETSYKVIEIPTLLVWNNPEIVLHPGVNSFSFYSGITSTKNNESGTSLLTKGEVIPQDRFNLLFPNSELIEYGIERRTGAPTYKASYTPTTPVKAGSLDIRVEFAEAISTIPSISINQPGTVDISNAEMSLTSQDRKTWLFKYIVHQDNQNEYKNGTATVTISNAVDIYGRIYSTSTLQNNTFVINAALESDPTNREVHSVTSTITPDKDGGNSSTLETTTNTTQYQNNTTINSISRANSMNLVNAFSDSDIKLLELENTAGSQSSKILSVSTINSYNKFVIGSNIYIKVVYKKNPKSKMPTEGYMINGYNFSVDNSPLFADFSNVDLGFDSKKQLVSEEKNIEGNIYERTISYKLTGDKIVTDKSGLSISIIFSDGLGIKQINDTVKVNVVKPNIIVNSYEISRQVNGKSDVVVLNPEQVETMKIIKDDVKDIGFTIKGKAEPNTTLYLHIYSEPVIVNVKTNDKGEWSYTLKEDFEIGTHNIYASLAHEGIAPSELVQITDFKVYATKVKADEDIYKDLSTSNENVTLNPTSTKSKIVTPIMFIVFGVLLICITLVFIFIYIKKTSNNSIKEAALQDNVDNEDT